MKKICNICGKKVVKDGSCDGLDYSINCAVVGKNIQMSGHRTCVENLNQMVLLPNRIRIKFLAWK
jgi:hypothetical protein